MYVTQYIIGCLLSFQDTTHTHTKKKQNPTSAILKIDHRQGYMRHLHHILCQKKEEIDASLRNNMAVQCQPIRPNLPG